MKIDVSTWKDFCLSKLFEVSAGIYYYKDEYADGDTPYCSATAENNGVAKKIDLDPDFQGNKIITGKVGCDAFYQPEPFCATSDVNVLSPNFEMNEAIGLFIVAVINKDQNYRWNYGRQCRVGDTKNIVIKLPIKQNANGTPVLDKKCMYSEEGYIPDWNYMEQYINSLHNKRLTTNQTKGKKISITKWQAVRFGDLLESIYKAKANVKTDLDISDIRKDGYIRYVSRTENNNACDGYIEKNKVEGIEVGNAITIGDTTATCAYQDEEFACGDHMIVCRASWMNKYTSLFIVTLLNKEKYRYCYGRAFLKDAVQNTMLLLPMQGDNPDWEYMTKYIKELPYGDRL